METANLGLVFFLTANIFILLNSDLFNYLLECILQLFTGGKLDWN
jgi:hypothetical protein